MSVFEAICFGVVAAPAHRAIKAMRDQRVAIAPAVSPCCRIGYQLLVHMRAVSASFGKQGSRTGMGSSKVAPGVSVLIVKAQTYRDFEALVLDNASSDHSTGTAQSLVVNDSRYTLGGLGENVGVAAGNNLMAATARGPRLALLNPDAVPAPD